jgi:UDP-N-acetylmuramate: L-alanyl-gamma-D-glutamyl-meso-diaminopimelate ligase
MVDVLSEDTIKAAFGRDDLKIFENRFDLEDYLRGQSWEKRNLLLMSSGNFDGMDIPALSEKIIKS